MKPGLAVAGLLSALVYGLLMLLSRFREPIGFAFIGFLWLFLVHIGLWVLFSWLDAKLVGRWPDSVDAGRRIGAYSVSGLLIGVAFFDLTYVGLRLLEPWLEIGDGELSATHLLSASGIGALLSAVVGAVALAWFDSNRWRRAEETVRDLREEGKALELGALRRQLDPHFLFNSLNTLTALISEDPDKAGEFSLELADVYRYVLGAASSEVVLLEEELRSMRSLVFLFEQRFESGLSVAIDVEEAALGKAIVPLTLHTLLENCIEHNVVTRERPLVVHVSGDVDRLEVRNTIDLRPEREARAKSGIGLENLSRSYELLAATDQFEFGTVGNEFIVKVPLLDREN